MSKSTRQVMSLIIMISPWISRFSVEIFGLNIRFESIVGLVSFIFLIHGLFQKRLIFKTIQLPATILLVWLLLQVIISAYKSPDFTSSLNLVVWIFLNLMSLIWLVLFSNFAEVLKFGFRIAAFMVVLGISFYILWLATGLQVGMQVDPTYGGVALYVSVFEANIYAGLIAIWSLIAMTQHGVYAGNITHRIILWVTPIALVLAQTRTALVAWLIGVILINRKSISLLVISTYSFLLLLLINVLVDLTSKIPIGFQKFKFLFNFSEGNGLYRQNARKTALGDLNSPADWLTGLGFNSFGHRHLDPTLHGVPWYLGDVTLQVIYGGGLMSFGLIAFLTFKVFFSLKSFNVFVLFLSWYTLGTSTSTLWLIQTWIYVGLTIMLLNERQANSNLKRVL